MMRALAGRLLALGIVLSASIAHADGAGDAKPHLAKAKAHFDLQEYADAEKELKEAYRLDPKPDVLYAIAQAQRMGGECKKAIVSYKTYLRGNPPAAQRKLAEDNITTCEAILAKPPDKPDGRPDKPPDKSIEPPDKPDRPPDKPDRPPDKPDKPDKPTVERVEIGTPWYRDLVAHGFVIGGAAAIAGGIVLAKSGQRTIDSIDDARFYDDFAARSGKAGGAKTKRTLGIIGAGVGAAAIGVGIIIYKVRSPSVVERPVKTATRKRARWIAIVPDGISIGGEL